MSALLGGATDPAPAVRDLDELALATTFPRLRGLVVADRLLCLAEVSCGELLASSLSSETASVTP
jgi:hypothetical protein